MRGLPGEMIRFCTLLTLALLAAPVRADASELPAGGSLAGVRGLLRVAAAANQPAGTISLGTEAGFYWMPEMLAGGQDHSRLVNSLTVAFTPWRYIEAALSARVVSDSSSGGAAGDELQVAVGDPRLVVKGGGEVGAGVSVGAAVDLRFLAGAGYFESAASATSALFSLLAGWQGDPGIPLGIHLNVGFRYDGSSSLVSDPSQLSEAQRLAIGLSSFHQVVSRLGVEVTTRYVGPFLEISLENLVGSGAPGFSDHPRYVSGGLRVWPPASKSLQLLAAVDLDPLHAEGWYYAGLASLRAGEPSQALGELAAALELDVAPGRPLAAQGQALRELGEEPGARFVSTSANFEAALLARGDRGYFHDSCHLSVEGYDLLARIVARAILSAQPLAAPEAGS